MEKETIKKLVEYYLPYISAVKGAAYKQQDISEKQLNHICTYAKNVEYEDILGLIDFTVTGSAKDGMVFTIEGIYYKEIGRKPNHILYKNIRKVEINNFAKKDNDNEILFYCNDEGTWDDQIITSFVRKTLLAELLEEIAEQMAQPFEISFSSEKLDEEKEDTSGVDEQEECQTETLGEATERFKNSFQKVHGVMETDKNKKAKQSAELFRNLKVAAGDNEVEVQFQLGKCYDEGILTEPDERLAVYWYTKAAMQHHGEAMCRLAEYYYTGKYVYEDEALAEALLLVSTAREMAADRLQKWFDIDIAKDGTYCHHASMMEAVEHVNQFIKNANHDILEMIEDEIIDEEYEDGEDDDNWEHFYPKPNKYFLPKTNAELFIGNIKRKLGL